MSIKIGRNDMCPCGSGLKYKKCCLNENDTRFSDMNNSVKENNVRTIICALKSISNSKRIPVEEGNGFYRVFGTDNIEKVNPIEYLKHFELHTRAITLRDLLILKEPELASNVSYDFYVRFAQKNLDEEKFWESKEQVKVPENFLNLLETSKKKEQESLLKGLSINPTQLISLIFKSYKDYGYLYSRYRFENLPKGLENKKKPIAANISNDGHVETIGETELTKGQVKNMIEQRKVIVANFFDKGNDWHCLFTTYNSLQGKENWKDGQAHFHYISSAFGISREDFIESMRNGQYKSTSIHIDLLDYGKQTNNGG